MQPVVRSEATALLQAYLERFPDEAGALMGLTRQLAEPSEDPFARGNMRGHITTSALVLSPRADAVLMIHHRALQRWLPPGGHYEGPGSLWASASREVAEETGVGPLTLCNWEVGAGGLPLNIDSHPIAANPAKQEGAHVHHDFRFLARATVDNPLIIQESEIHAARWVPLWEFSSWVEADMQRLVAKLMRALPSIQATN